MASTQNANTWTVYRQDDNGNQFVVEGGLTKNAADAMVAELESHGHKQHYWASELQRNSPTDTETLVDESLESLNAIAAPDFKITAYDGWHLTVAASITDYPDAWHAKITFAGVSYIECPTEVSHPKFRSATPNERASLATKTPLEDNDRVIAITAETMADIESKLFFIVCESVTLLEKSS